MLVSVLLIGRPTFDYQQVVSLTQIQLEEAMKPARYEAPLPQQLPLGERGSMVLDPGTTVASMAGKDKLSGSATGPIGSLLAGDKIQFGRFLIVLQIWSL